MILRLVHRCLKSSWGPDCIPLIDRQYLLQTFGWDSEKKVHRWFTLPVVEFDDLSTEEQLQASIDVLKLKDAQYLKIKELEKVK